MRVIRKQNKYLSVGISFLCVAKSLISLSTMTLAIAVQIQAAPSFDTADSSDSSNLPSSREIITEPIMPQSLIQERKFDSNEQKPNNVCCKLHSEGTLTCSGTVTKGSLKVWSENNSRRLTQLVLVNLTQHGLEPDEISLEDLQLAFPSLKTLKIVNNTTPESVMRIFASLIIPENTTMAPSHNSSTFSAPALQWESVEELDLSGNHIESEWIPASLLTVFPNLRRLNLSKNNVSNLLMLDPSALQRLESIDLSNNPLDCTSNFDWIGNGSVLANAQETLCQLPSYQIKPKPLLKVYPHVQRVRQECRNVNCSCTVDYIWEQGNEVYARNLVNCSHRNLTDFPDPDLLPQRVDTLHLHDNEIRSLETFATDERWERVGLINLFLDNNKISSIGPLEGSEWLFSFQILSLRGNKLKDIPVYILESPMQQNRRLCFLDLSQNPWHCDCHTALTFRVWLLRYSKFIRNIEDVRCANGFEQIRHLRMEDWCPVDEITAIELLDVVSILLALLILAIIFRLLYDYRNYRKHGVLPWIVMKM